MTQHTRPREIRMTVCVGLLGAAATLVLRPAPMVVGVAVGVFLVCLLVVLFRSLHRAADRIDRIMADELKSDGAGAVTPSREEWRKTA
jgi:hypothetical protein